MSSSGRSADVALVCGRAFARTGPHGTLDGTCDRGIYAEDLRLVRRAVAWRDDAGAVRQQVEVGQRSAAVRFELPAVPARELVSLLVELDGTDLFSIRRLELDASDDHGSTMALADTSPQAWLRVEASCEHGAVADRDGFAAAGDIVELDGKLRAGTWTWCATGDGAPVDVTIELRIGWSVDGSASPPAPEPFSSVAVAREGRRSRWLGQRPTVSGPEDVRLTVDRSLSDLADLRIDGDAGAILAAGVPWFLTAFGRDSLLASWMSLPVDPELAASTLRHLARHQATVDDETVDAEPGKILHEERRAVAAARWHERYYGSVDATPLFVMLLAETWRWTGDDALPRELETPARFAIGWIQSRMRADPFGLVGYQRRATRGLDVQSWKDSHDSQRDRAGRVASGRLYALEAQAYAVAAARAGAELADGVWRDPVAADDWREDAETLAARMLDRFEVSLPRAAMRGETDPRRDGLLAQGLDAHGRQLDSLCSNQGHVLWSRAVDDLSLARRIAGQLASPQLWSGWGVRTMSTLDAAYDPLSYHCGSVWPHDTAICVAGAAAVDVELAASLARAVFDAAAACGGRLPELFSGRPRSETPDAPEPYAATCSPQAWAAAAPLLVLRTLLGLEPATDRSRLLARADAAPTWLRGLRWHGVHALGTRWNIAVDGDGAVRVEPGS